MKRVFETEDLAEAELVCAMLASYGLRATVLGTAVHGEPGVWVLDDAHEIRARTLVKERPFGRSAAGDAQPAWRCTKCGQEVDAHFTACWSCGSERA